MTTTPATPATPVTLTDQATSSRTLAPYEETVRCTVCGDGAMPGNFERSAQHIVTTLVRNGATRDSRTGYDHDVICDNVAPDGSVHPFGRITQTWTVGPYTICRVESPLLEGGTSTAYTAWIDGDAIAATDWKRSDQVVWTHHCHDSLDEALTFAVAYRNAGPNAAQYLAPHFMRGLSD